MKTKCIPMDVEQFDFRPTQAVVGDLEVRHKIGIIHSFKRASTFQKYLKKHIVPIVIGPKGVPYIVDNHHFMKAIMQTRRTQYVYGTIIMDLSNMKTLQFWNTMVKNNWVYLKDERGMTIPPNKLPKNIFLTKNDHYRALAWMTREYGGFSKVYVPFSEFLWANFLRKHIKIHPKDHHLHHALTKSLKLARSKKARHLPGFKK